MEVKFERIAGTSEIQRNINPTTWQEIRGYIFYFLRIFLVVTLVYVFIRTNIFDLIGVNGQSMYPNYNENTKRDSIYIDQFTPKFSDYKRGDVIVLLAPGKCNNNKDGNRDLYIKRVIGLPGEKVVFEDGKVYIINEEFPSPGVELSEISYLPETVRTYKNGIQDDGLRYEEPVVPEDHYYFLGDNRPISADSRVCGVIDKSEIIGREFFRLSPEEKRGYFESPGYNITNQ